MQSLAVEGNACRGVVRTFDLLSFSHFFLETPLWLGRENL
jgi:hypothetical protein